MKEDVEKILLSTVVARSYFSQSLESLSFCLQRRWKRNPLIRHGIFGDLADLAS